MDSVISSIARDPEYEGFPARRARFRPFSLPDLITVRELDAAVVEVLEERYPDDEATGYAAGDLRGAVTVKMKLE